MIENRPRDLRPGSRNRTKIDPGVLLGDPGASRTSPGMLGDVPGRYWDQPGIAKIVHFGTILGSKIDRKSARAPKTPVLDHFSDLSGLVMVQSLIFVRCVVDVSISRPSRNTAHGDEFEVLHVFESSYKN